MLGPICRATSLENWLINIEMQYEMETLNRLINCTLRCYPSCEKLLDLIPADLIIEGKSVLCRLLKRAADYEDRLNGIIGFWEDVLMLFIGTVAVFTIRELNGLDLRLSGNETLSIIALSIGILLCWIAERPVLSILKKIGTSKERLNALKDVVKKALEKLFRAEKPVDANTQAYVSSLMQRNPDSLIVGLLRDQAYSDLLRLPAPHSHTD